MVALLGPDGLSLRLHFIEGTLTLEGAPNQSAVAKGKLAVKLGAKIDGKFNFIGQYDNGGRPKTIVARVFSWWC